MNLLWSPIKTVVSSACRQIKELTLRGDTRVKLLAAGLLLGLLVVASLAVASAAYANTPSLDPPFDSDLQQNGNVQICNPENLLVGRVAQMVIDWNDQTQILPGADPRFVLVGPDQFCELRIDAQGGNKADYYAQIVFTVHPDNLDYSTRFSDLTSSQKRGTLNHEGGHTFGLAHPPVSRYWCGNSVMPTLQGCKSISVTRRTIPGPEDVAALESNWDGSGPGPNPVPNKCWDNVDADGDGVCDRYGPPGASVTSKSNATGSPVPVSPPIDGEAGGIETQDIRGW